MTTTATGPTRLSLTVDRFLDAIGAGAGVPGYLLAADIVLDAMVPDWRFTVRGSEAVARQYGAWFRSGGIRGTGAVAGGRRRVITYLLTWEENGVPQAAHHCHMLRFDGEDASAGTASVVVGAGTRRGSPRWRPRSMLVDVRALAPSVDDLLAGAEDRRPFPNPDGRSSSAFEHVRIDAFPMS